MKQFTPLVTAGKAAAAVWAGCLLSVAVGCGREQPLGSLESPHASVGQEARISAPSDPASIDRFCGDCHAIPSPQSFAKSRWEEEVAQGFRLYQNSRRTDLQPTDFDATLAFFRDAAPDELVIPIPERVTDQRFRKQSVLWPHTDSLSAVSSLLLGADQHGNTEIFLTDLWTGTIAKFSLDRQGRDLGTASQPPRGAAEIRAELLADLAHPAHIEQTDLDGDGRPDWVVADLGTLNPQPEQQGTVWWLREELDGTVKSVPLRLGLARVADVRPLDIDGDGDQDLVVGDFGLHFVGGISLGINESVEKGIPKFTWKEIDSRPGTIALPTLDFDGDEKTDFLALVTQHYETIEFHRNLGNGEFQPHVIHATGDPASGSSSMEVVDFDGDGDLDVLYTCGDTFDDGLAKPYHQILWLENEGRFPFTAHQVGSMPGCYRAVSGDLDNDGDLDIAAVALLGPQEVAKYPAGTFDGVAWFEQLTDGSSKRHSLVQDRCKAATCMILDWDGDGWLDLLVPPCNTQYQSESELEVFINRGGGVAQQSAEKPGEAVEADQ